MIGDEELSALKNSTINVPDAEDNVVFFDPDMDPEQAAMAELERLAKLRQVLGDEGLTEEERITLAAAEAVADAPAPATDHYANLAEHMESESDLNSLAADVIQWVKWDMESRSDWYAKEKEGITKLGLTSHKDTPVIEGGSIATHPALAEACVQFAARSLDQMWPAGGPVRTVVIGKKTEEKLARSRRVAAHMNYQYTEQLEDAFDQLDKMLVRLPLSGSMFTKVYEDPVSGRCRELVDPANLVVPYKADSLRTAPRYTEIVPLSDNVVNKRVAVGYYRKVRLLETREDPDSSGREELEETVKATEGREDVGPHLRDQPRTIYECYCELDLKGFEDYDEFGRKTGIRRPYVVHVDRSTSTVLAIYRNWDENDPKKEREIIHTHWKFLPGLGFYGYGMYHWIAGLVGATTGSLRALLDAAAFSNVQGGFRAKDAAMRPQDMTISPGKWKEVDVEADDLRKAFFVPPYSEPSGTLFNLMVHMQELAQRFVGSTDALVGSGDKNTPVGTMLARIEQGSKVMTTVHKRLHRAAKSEFKLMAKLNVMFMPPEPTPFNYEEGEYTISPEDYTDVSILPVSDPNFISNAHRHFVTQVLMELQASAPHLYNEYALHRRALMALKVEDADELLRNPEDQVTRLDPVTENALAMTGRPIHVYTEQAHDAHIMVHTQLAETMPPADPRTVALQAHIQEHVAHQYILQMAKATGLPFTFPGPDATSDDMAPPPEAEVEASLAAAEAAAVLLEQQRQAAAQPSPDILKAQAEIERKDAIARADIERKNAIARADMTRKNATVTAGEERKNATMVADEFRKQVEAENAMEILRAKSDARVGKVSPPPENEE